MLDEFGKDESVVPLAELSLVLIGPKVVLGHSVLQVLGREDIVALFTDWRGVPIAGGFGWPTHSRVAARHLSQANLALPRRKNAWGRIIRAKVRGQAVVARQFGDHRLAERLLAMSKQVRSGDPGNVEAAAARAYWNSILTPGESRVPQLRTGVNAALHR